MVLLDGSVENKKRARERNDGMGSVAMKDGGGGQEGEGNDTSEVKWMETK